MKPNFQNKTVLITGATRGLGAHLAACFWRHGANLLLIARDAGKLSAMQTQFSVSAKASQKIEIIPTDLANSASVAALIQQISHVDILINNAAIQGPIGPLWENDWQSWQTTLQVNLTAPVLLSRAVLPSMIQNRFGKIINLSGGGATNARPGFSAYATAKAGLVNFSETVAAEVKPYNIMVNCIAPGIMNTDMLQDVLHAGVDKSGDKEFLNASQYSKADDSALIRAAKLCLFLASDECDGITGKLISAVWDPWLKLADYLHEINNSDIYTLKRILPKDRGMEWGEV